MTIRVTILKNGIRVVTQKLEGSGVATAGVWFGAGMRDEEDRVNGIAHFNEHLCFKGTTRRNAQQINEDVENRGAGQNAYTGEERTAYFAYNILPEHIAAALDVVADMVRDSQIPPAELEPERKVVIQEIQMYRDDPNSLLFYALAEAAFGKQELGRTILGPEQIIANVSREDLLKFVKDKYTSANTVVCAAGNVDHDEFVKVAEKLFGDMPARAAPKRTTNAYVGGDARIQKDLEVTRMAIALPGVSMTDPDATAYALLATALSGGRSALLDRKVAEPHRGKIFGVGAHSETYTDCGSFFISGSTTPDSGNLFIEEAIKAFRTAGQDLTEADLAKAKKLIIGSLSRKALQSHKLACELAESTLYYGTPLPLQAQIAEINAVTLADLKKVHARLLEGKPSFAAVGKVQGLMPYAAIERKLKGEPPAAPAAIPPARRRAARRFGLG